jgi:hypothetical protein
MCAKLAASIVYAALALAAIAAHGAPAQRTFVASTGVDANPCTINQPCRTFGAAIAQTVIGGEVIVQDSAGYGIVTVTKSVSIIAPTGIYAGISVFSGQTGITVNAPGATVLLRGLSINGAAAGSVNGVHLVQGARLRVEGCVVSNLSSVGIVQDGAGSEMVVLDTIIRDNGGRGVSMVADATAVLDNVRVEHNGGDGIYFAAGSSRATATIRRSVLSHNAAAGVAAAMPATPAVTRVTIEDSVIANNAGDGVFAGGVLDGRVAASVRRNSITSNGLSGISAFAGSATGHVSTDAVENTFSDNPTSHIKADGPFVDVFLSRNDFSYGSADYSSYTANGALVSTYQDNTGWAGYNGNAPFKLTPF